MEQKNENFNETVQNVAMEEGAQKQNSEDKTIDFNDASDKRSMQNDAVDSSEDKKEKKQLSSVSLKDRSEEFIAIIEAALKFEKISRERNNLKSKNKELSEDCKSLSKCLAEKEKENEKQAEEITRLKTDVEHRNEVIDIVKADKSESAQEYKNALAASLKTYYGDYMELKKMEMSADVGEAMSVTLEGVFGLLEKNGIAIGK